MNENFLFSKLNDLILPPPARAFFEGRRGDLAWNVAADHSSGDLGQDLEPVLDALLAAGYSRIYRIDMTNHRFGIPVVKVLVLGLAPLTF